MPAEPEPPEQHSQSTEEKADSSRLGYRNVDEEQAYDEHDDQQDDDRAP